MNIHNPIEHPEAQPRWRRWLLLGWFLLALILGVYGYCRADQEYYAEIAPLDALYNAAGLFLLHMPGIYKQPNWALEAARWMAALFFCYAALAVVFKLFHREVAWLLHRRLAGHVVLCGLGGSGLQILRALRKPRATGPAFPVVVIDAAPEAERVEAAEAMGASVIVGDAGRAEVLAEARVGHAHRLVAACPQDASNVQVAIQAQALAIVAGRTPRNPLLCHIQVTDLDMRAACQRIEAFAETEPACQLQFFDLFDSAARRLLIDEMPLDRPAGLRANDPRQAALVIVGFGRMGRALAVRAAKLAHFANGRPLRLTIIDQQAALQEQRLLFRYPAFREIADLDVHALDAESLEARRVIQEACDPARFCASVALCPEEEFHTTEIALQLLPMLRAAQTPLAVRFLRDERLIRLLNLRPRDLTPGGAVRAFGVVEDAWLREAVEDARHIALARAIYERSAASGCSPAAQPKTDTAHWHWNQLDEVERERCYQQADHLPVKLRAIQCEIVGAEDPRPAAAFPPEEVELLARMEHARRMAAHRLECGRAGAAGADRPPDAAPRLLPWADLDEPTRDLCREAVRAIPSLLEPCGQKVARRALAPASSALP